MEHLMTILKDALLQEGTLVFLAGEAGIGKTRLAEEFEEKAVQTDCVTLNGRCIPGVASPFLPFIEAFRNYFRAPLGGNKELSEEMLFGKLDSNIEGSWSMDRILFSTLEFIRRKSAIRPMIIRIEDLHWVDSASVQLLHFLARNASNLKLVLLCTYRPEDLIPDSLGNPHPLTDALRIMKREGVCQVIELGDLNPSEVETLVGGVLGGRLEPKVMEMVVAESEGNPLYAIESTKLLALTESIMFEKGEWRSSGKLEIVIPPTVKEVILRRLERVAKPQRRLLDFASVLGREFDMEILGEISNTSKMELLENLELIEREGRLVCQKGEDFHFSHDTIREVTYESISVQRRKEIHKLTGEVLERSGRGDVTSPLLALHFRLGGDRARCVKYSLRSGECCEAKGAAIEAIPYLEQVMDCAGEDNSFEADRIRAWEALGFSHLLLGRLDSASEYLENVVSKTGLDKASFKTLIGLCDCWSGVGLGKGDPSKSLMYLDMAEKVASKISEKGKVAETRATENLWGGDFQSAERNFQTAIDLMLQSGDFDAVVKCKAYLSDVFLTQGKVQEAFEETQDALKLAKSIPGFYGELEASFYAGMVQLHIGNLRESIELLKRSVEIATKIGEYSALCWGYTNLSLAFEMLDNNQDAFECAKRSYEASKSTESAFIMLNGISGYLHMCTRMGRIEQAHILYEEALEILKDFNWGMHSTTRCLLSVAMAEYCASAREWSESEELFEQSFELMRGTPVGLLLEGLSRTWYAQLLARKNEPNSAKSQLTLALSIFSKLRNQYQMERVKGELARLG